MRDRHLYLGGGLSMRQAAMPIPTTSAMTYINSPVVLTDNCILKEF